jgi:hypothetical protein
MFPKLSVRSKFNNKIYHFSSKESKFQDKTNNVSDEIGSKVGQANCYPIKFSQRIKVL